MPPDLFCLKAIVFTVLLMFYSTLALAAPQDKECVIVLHGLGRTETSMEKIEKRLIKDNYRVWNEAYPSRDADIETLAATHVPLGVRQCEKWNAAAIHFVTHSMGGILVRQHLQSNEIPATHTRCHWRDRRVRDFRPLVCMDVSRPQRWQGNGGKHPAR